MAQRHWSLRSSTRRMASRHTTKQTLDRLPCCRIQQSVLQPKVLGFAQSMDQRDREHPDTRSATLTLCRQQVKSHHLLYHHFCRSKDRHRPPHILRFSRHLQRTVSKSTCHTHPRCMQLILLEAWNATLHTHQVFLSRTLQLKCRCRVHRSIEDLDCIVV